LGLGGQRCGYGMAGGISGMNNTPVTVTAFASEVKLGVCVSGKVNAVLNKPFNALFAVLYGKPHGLFIAQAPACNQRILHMVFGGILVVQNGGYAALGPKCGAAADVGFANNAYLQMLRKIKRNGQAGSAAADNENIVFIGLWHRVVIAGHNVDVY